MHTTVDGRGKKSEPNTAGISKLDCRYFELMQIDKVKIALIHRKVQETKMPKFHNLILNPIRTGIFLGQSWTGGGLI